MAPVLYSRDSVAVHYQSKGIPFQEWLGQITLCFAPYAAHVLIGVPQFISLQKGQQPRWTDKINFFNPTTIIWRYVSIFDRRIRAHTWTAENMAASNAAFFTARGWNGSEALMGLLGENWLIRTPSGTRITLLSVSAIGTIVVSFQGVQALYELIFQIRTGVPLIQGLGGIFLPLAVFGLLRVFPAMWLSDEFAYKSAAQESREAQELEALIQIPRNRESNSYTESNKVCHTLSLLLFMSRMPLGIKHVCNSFRRVIELSPKPQRSWQLQKIQYQEYVDFASESN